MSAGPVSPASTDSGDDKATVIRSGSDTSSGDDEDESLPFFAATPSRMFAKAADAASPAQCDDSVLNVTPACTDSANSKVTDIHTGSDTSSCDEEELLAAFEATPGSTAANGHNAATPGSINSLFEMTPGSPPSLGLGSPFVAGSPLSLSALGNFDDLLMDEDGFEAISPLPELTAVSTSPRLGTGTMTVFCSPLRGLPTTTTTWTVGQMPTSSGSNAGTPPRRKNEPYVETIFSPLPLVGALAAQRLPADDLHVVADLGSPPWLALTQSDLVAVDGACNVRSLAFALAERHVDCLPFAAVHDGALKRLFPARVHLCYHCMGGQPWQDAKQLNSIAA